MIETDRPLPQVSRKELSELDRQIGRNVSQLIEDGATIQLGMRYSLEMPVEKYYRDSKIYQVGEGTVNIMRLLIADDALGYKKANRQRLKLPSQFKELE